MLGKKHVEGSSRYVSWSMRAEEEADIRSALRIMFCSSFSRDISELHLEVSKYVAPIGQWYPALATHVIESLVLYFPFL